MMGPKDSVNQNLQLSQCMTIEYLDGFNPASHVCVPGTRIKGQVVIRNPKVLSVGEIRVTLYGISDAYIHRKISGIRADFYGRGFLFQEIKTLTTNPTNLQPNPEQGHRLPFEFALPQSTSPMAENEANFINKWQTKPSFAGANDMHALPPSCKSYKKALLGFTESTISYRLDATCTKIKGGSSWLPQAATTITFNPVRSEQMPDPRLQPVRLQHQMKPSQAVSMILYVPSVCYAGGPFPLQLAYEGATNIQAPAVLTSLDIRLEGIYLTRGRSFLFREKESSEVQEIPISTTTNLSIPIGPQAIDLASIGFRIGIPQNVTPCFKSFTVAQLLYRVIISYTVRLGTQTVTGKLLDRYVEVLPAVCRVGASP